MALRRQIRSRRAPTVTIAAAPAVPTIQSIFGSKLHTYIDAAAGITIAEGVVTAAADQSGNGHDFAGAGTVTLVEADAAWDGQPSLSFEGGELISTESASVWKFLHDGTGAAILAPNRPTSVDASQFLIATKNVTGTNIGIYIQFQGGNLRYIAGVSSGGGNQQLSPATATAAVNGLHSVYWFHKAGLTPNTHALHYPSGTLRNPSNQTPSVSDSDPQTTLKIGRIPGGTGTPFIGTVPLVVILNDLPTAPELAAYVAYMQARFPSLTA